MMPPILVELEVYLPPWPVIVAKVSVSAIVVASPRTAFGRTAATAVVAVRSKAIQLIEICD